jgi:putative FmdB family regulatory protein
MPTYTYKCGDCGHIFDEFHLMSETVDKCKRCESNKVNKVIGKGLNFRKKTKVSSRKVGSVVEEYIKNATDDLNDQKSNLKEEQYEIK